MNINFYKDIMTKNTLNPDDLKIYYNFSNISGDSIVFNELYSTGTQYNDGCVIFDNNPGFIVGYNPSGFNDYFGSGFFYGDSIFRIGNTINYDNWTLFLGYQNSGCQIDRNIGTILISNKENIYDQSGFCLGYNGAGKFFIELTKDNLNKTYSTNFLSKKNNLISLSKNNNIFEISMHDVASNSHFTESYLLDDYKFSNLWFLGNSYNKNNFYTGFKGYIDDFIMISGFISNTKRIELSKALFITGYIPATTVLKQETFLKNDSVSYLENQIIGTGITGYQNINIGSIPRKEGPPIGICLKSGITGFLYGDVVQFNKTVNSGTRNYYERRKEQFLYDNNSMLKYSESSLKFLYSLDEKDIYEIYTFLTNSNNIKNLNLTDPLTNSIYLDVPYSGQSVNLYLNGVLEQAVLNQQNLNLSGGYYLDEPQNIYSSGIYDALIDDINYYQSINSGVYLTYTGTLDGYVAPANINNILYLNGQKLISGMNYYLSGGNIYIKTNEVLATGGILYLSNDLNGYSNYVSGKGNELQNINSNVINEKVWINGVLQVENEDYLKGACTTLLITNNLAKGKTYLIYDNYSNFFNLS